MKTSPDSSHFVIPPLQGLLNIVLANSESVPLQSQYACILLNPNILKNLVI